jgi:predicted dehydrogenase
VIKSRHLRKSEIYFSVSRDTDVKAYKENIMSKKIRIGMVGLGFITDWHYKGFSSIPDVEIVGLCQDFYGSKERIGKKKEQLSQKCKELNIKPYGSFDEMVADPSMDALIIGSINPYHYDQIVKGLNAGKHLMVEKPVVTDIKQVDAIKKISQKKKCVLFPAHNFVYRGAVAHAKEVMKSGKLGKLIHSSFIVTHTISEEHATGWRSKKALGTGGTLIDSGHHLIYQTLYLLGMPQSIQAFKSKLVLKNMQCEDTAQINMLFKDGSVCCLMQSWASNHGEGINGIRILGENGNLIITDALYCNGEKLNGDVEYGNSFANQARAFVRAIREGTPPVSTLDDVRNTLRITFGAYESAEKKKVITF